MLNTYLLNYHYHQTGKSIYFWKDFENLNLSSDELFKGKWYSFVLWSTFSVFFLFKITIGFTSLGAPQVELLCPLYLFSMGREHVIPDVHICKHFLCINIDLNENAEYCTQNRHMYRKYFVWATYIHNFNRISNRNWSRYVRPWWHSIQPIFLNTCWNTGLTIVDRSTRAMYFYVKLYGECDCGHEDWFEMMV